MLAPGAAVAEEDEVEAVGERATMGGGTRGRGLATDDADVAAGVGESAAMKVAACMSATTAGTFHNYVYQYFLLLSN